MLSDMLLNLSFKIMTKVSSIQLGDIITKPDKGNGVAILDRKLYNNAIEQIISDTSKYKKLNEDPILKREVSLRKLRQKNF